MRCSSPPSGNRRYVQVAQVPRLCIHRWRSLCGCASQVAASGFQAAFGGPRHEGEILARYLRYDSAAWFIRVHEWWRTRQKDGRVGHRLAPPPHQHLLASRRIHSHFPRHYATKHLATLSERDLDVDGTEPDDESTVLGDGRLRSRLTILAELSSYRPSGDWRWQGREHDVAPRYFDHWWGVRSAQWRGAADGDGRRGRSAEHESRSFRFLQASRLADSSRHGFGGGEGWRRPSSLSSPRWRSPARLFRG